MNTNTPDVYVQIAYDTLRNGGGTYARDAYRTAVLPNRYVVALGKPHAHIVESNEGAGAFPHIVHALRSLADQRGVWNPYRALGTWVSDGKVYVDIVESIYSRDVALAVARDRGELAIWDTVDKVSIDVPQIDYAVPPWTGGAVS